MSHASLFVLFVIKNIVGRQHIHIPSCVFTLLLFLCWLPELKEQLLAHSSQVDDIECLKTEFNEQKREIKEQNEAELENLRRYK